MVLARRTAALTAEGRRDDATTTEESHGMDAHDDPSDQDRSGGLWADGAGDGARDSVGELPGDAPHDGSADPPPAEPPPPTKVCPRCSVAERTTGAFCSHCRTPYDRSAARRARRR